jgi:hypothetical protein
MPMQGYPPGGPPGTPPPGGAAPPPGGGWGGPPGPGGPGTPPPGGFPPAQPPKKSRTGLYVGLGCGCMLVLACLVGGGILAMGGGLASLMGPGEEVASTPIAPGQEFALSYVQDGSQKYRAWLEVDVSHSGGYSLSGPILLSENGQAFGQYTLAETGQGSPVQERSSSTRINWSSTHLGGSGSASGTVSLFPIPARTAGSTVTLSGTVNAPPGTTGTLRLFVAERD